MINLTQDQISAIEFFEENFNYVEAFGLFNLDREDRISYNKGKKLVDSAILGSKKIPGKIEFYTHEERSFIAAAYNQGMNRKSIVNEFVKEFGKSHSEDSIGQKVEMIKSVDSTCSNHRKFQFRDMELLEILQDLDFNRYSL